VQNNILFQIALGKTGGMKLRKTIIGELALISIDEEVGPAKIKELKKMVQALLLDNTLKIVINLEHVRSMDSAGVGVIVYVLKRVRRAGGDLKLCAPKGDVRNIFRSLKLDRIIDIFDDITNALASFTPQQSSAQEALRIPSFLTNRTFQ